MELMECMKKRRSVRAYRQKSVHRAMLEQLVEAAVLAPTWKNSQTGRYHIVTSPSLLETIRKEALPAFNAENCKDASALIITSFVQNRSGFDRDGMPSNEIGNGWGYYDLGLQNENLMLKATELGLSTLVMGIRDSKKLRSCLTIPDEEIIVSVIAVGYASQQPSMPKRKTVADIAKFYELS